MPPVWIIELEQVVDGRVLSRRKVMSVERSPELSRLEDLGLSLDEGKAILAELQATFVEQQFERDCQTRTACKQCGHRQRIKDHRRRQFDTVFGRVTVRRTRFECSKCGVVEPAAGALAARSTPEFDDLRAKLSAHLPYRVARDILRELLPISGGSTHTTLRNQTFRAADRIAEGLTDVGAEAERTPVMELTMGLDTAFVRARPDHPTRHIRVLVGEVLQEGGEHRYFAGVEQRQERHRALLHSRLRQHGYHRGTDLTLFTDGEDALQIFGRDAAADPVTAVLDWFHIAMRLRHMEQLATGLSTRVPSHARATKAIQTELDRLHWRLWNGRVDGVDVSLKRLSKSVAALRLFRRKRDPDEPSRKIWVMLHELKRYVRGHAHIFVNYAQRQRDGLRVSTSLVESAVNHLVNRRMNKRQQMRWSTQGAHKLLQVRAAVVNGEFKQLVQRSRQPATTTRPAALPMAA